jgi:hypothetical protein
MTIGIFQVMTPQGRGRYFLREALQSKALVSIIELLADHKSLMTVRHACVDVIDINSIYIYMVDIRRFNKGVRKF